MTTEMCTSTSTLLRSLDHSLGSVLVLSAYARVDGDHIDIDRELERIALTTSASTWSHWVIDALIMDVRSTMTDMLQSAPAHVRGIAFFAEVGGSVADDVWVELPVTLPTQAYLTTGPVLTPLASAIERSQELVYLPDWRWGS